MIEIKIYAKISRQLLIFVNHFTPSTGQLSSQSATPSPVITTTATATVNVTTTPPAIVRHGNVANVTSRSHGNFAATSSTVPGSVIKGDDCLKGLLYNTVYLQCLYMHTTIYLCTGSAGCMRLMNRYVIPKIHEEWEAVADFMEYPIQAKNDLRAKHT